MSAIILTVFVFGAFQACASVWVWAMIRRDIRRRRQLDERRTAWLAARAPAGRREGWKGCDPAS